MNWNSLAPTLIKLGAPMLGEALGGPFGAIAGKILADAFGAKEATPVAVNKVIAKVDPDAAAQAAQAAEDKWLAALADIGKTQVSEIGQQCAPKPRAATRMQRWWRPLYALEPSLLECAAFSLTLLHALWNGQDKGIAGFATLSGLLMTYFAACFGVLGAYVNGRTREKQAAVTGSAVPSIVAEVLKALGRKK